MTLCWTKSTASRSVSMCFNFKFVMWTHCLHVTNLTRHLSRVAKCESCETSKRLSVSLYGGSTCAVPSATLLSAVFFCASLCILFYFIIKCMLMCTFMLNYFTTGGSWKLLTLGESPAETNLAPFALNTYIQFTAIGACFTVLGCNCCQCGASGS